MNELLNKLKNSVDYQILKKVDKSLWEQFRFVPLSVKDNFLFVVINSATDKDKVNEKLKEFFPEQIKFLQVPDQDLYDLMKDLGSDVDETSEGGMDKQARLGELLLQKGYINDMQLLQALAESKRLKMPIGSTLLKLGFILLHQLKEVLHIQTGYDFVTSEQLENMHKYVKLLPEDFIIRNQILPIYSDGKNLIFGAIHPVDPEVLKDIIYLTGLNPKQLLMTFYEFDSSFDLYFSEQKKATEKVIEEIESEAENLVIEESLAEMVEKQMQGSSGSIAKFANQILINAIETKASDIHIEPRLEGYIVRYRKDGILQKSFDIPSKVETSVLARFKVLSRMNIAEHRRPQDGTFSIKYKNESYDFRISSLPVSGKEKITIRILAPAVSLNAADKNINLVGGTEEDIAKIKNMISSPNGIILTSGPTGSGKTTTLYSVLKSLNDESVNITTIEDPIEIKLEGINQSQINIKAGITFASCMRAILRQDPDIILVGEIRDYETLEIAISAALTGHLVLSTVHTNSAASTVTRLIEMGAKDYLVASTLTGVIAQRLVRKLCDVCKEEYFPTYEEAKQIMSDENEIREFMKKPIYRSKGCNNCGFTGYKGRLGVFEIMPINKELKKLIADRSYDFDIEETAVKNGMRTLRQSCINHILTGQTTINEFIRVLGLVND